MATTRKRTTTAPKRRRRTTATKTVVRRRRRSSGLGAKLTKATITKGLKDAGEGAIGGLIANYVNKMPFIQQQTNPYMRLGIQAGLVIVTSALLKRPNIASGMAGQLAVGAVEDMGLMDSMNYPSLPMPPGYKSLPVPSQALNGYDYGLNEEIYSSDYANQIQ